MFKKFILLLIFNCSILSQPAQPTNNKVTPSPPPIVPTIMIITQQTRSGTYGLIYKDQRTVPRYFICGIQTQLENRYGKIYMKCLDTCQKLKHNQKITQKCIIKTHCEPTKSPYIGLRLNQMKATLCEINDFKNRRTLTQPGSLYDSKKYGQCPEDYFMNGFKVKTDQLNGITGLIIICINPFNCNKNCPNKQVLVFDGPTGTWGAPKFHLDNLVYGFQLKRSMQGHITGIKIYTSPKPFISSIKLNYNIQGNMLNPQIQIFDTFDFVNFGETEVDRVLQRLTPQQYQTFWLTDGGYLNGQDMKKLLTHQNKNLISVPIPILQKNTDRRFTNQYLKNKIHIQECQDKNDMKIPFRWVLNVSQTNIKQSDFYFGKVFSQKPLKKYENMNIKLKSCSKKYIRLMSVFSKISIPFTAAITFSNNVSTEKQEVKGNYRGIISLMTMMKEFQQNFCRL